MSSRRRRRTPPEEQGENLTGTHIQPTAPTFSNNDQTTLANTMPIQRQNINNTMGGPSTSNVVTMPNSNMTTSDELTPEEQAELQAIIASQRQQITAQMAARSATVSSSSTTPQQQQGMLQSIINAGSTFWNILALPSRADQATAWIKQKYENFTKQQRMINLKDKTGVQYRPSPSLNIVRAQGPEGIVVADRNYKTGVAQITALVELLRMYDILKEKLPMLQNSVNPIDNANAVSIQRQYAESYFLFVYLNQIHVNAAFESIKLLELAPSITTSKTIGRTSSFTTMPSSSMIPGIGNREETVTTLDQRTIESLNAAYNLLNRNATASVSSILGEQVQSSKLPMIADVDMPAAEELYNSIVQKRTVAIGFTHKNVQDKIISSGPLAGLAIAYLQNSNNVNINNISSEMIAADRDFEAYIAQIQTNKIKPMPVNLNVLRNAPALPNTSLLRSTPMLSSGNESTSNVMNEGGAHRRTQKRRHHKRRTNAKKQVRRSRYVKRR